LSLAIPADAIGPERAVDACQQFKRAVVAKAAGQEVRVTRDEIEAGVAARAPPPGLDDWGEAVGG
jgi:hypothetical protein